MVYILKDSGDFDLSLNCAFPNTRFAGMDSPGTKTVVGAANIGFKFQ